MGSFMPILLVAIVGIAIFAWYKKRKGKKNANLFLSNRKNKDEVWKTIKQFLKDNGEQGKEVIDSYVCKRDHIDAVNPHGSYLYKKNKNYELKIRKWQRNEINKQQKVSGQKQIKAPLARDIFVVVFQTRDSKTGLKETPRCFECEVINRKISKKEFDRKIVINGELDYDTEMEWIAPVRVAEAAKAEAAEKRLAKQRAAEEKRNKKNLMKQQKKAKKEADKNADKK